MADYASSPDPLQPLQSAIGILTVLLGGFMVALVVLLPFGSSIADIGSSTVCVSAKASSLGYQPAPVFSATRADGSGVETGGGDSIRAIAAGTDFGVDSVRLCDSSPGVARHALSAATSLPEVALTFGFLGLAHRMTRRARREGLFSADTARSVRLIGGYLGIGTVVVSVIQAVAAGALIGQLAPGTFSLGLVMEGWSVSVTALVASAGLITVSRVLSRAVALQEEVEATI